LLFGESSIVTPEARSRRQTSAVSSRSAGLSPDARNTTQLPSSEIPPTRVQGLFVVAPAPQVLTSSSVFVSRSSTNVSLNMSLSPATRSEAALSKATKRPSFESTAPGGKRPHAPFADPPPGFCDS